MPTITRILRGWGKNIGTHGCLEKKGRGAHLHYLHPWEKMSNRRKIVPLIRRAIERGGTARHCRRSGGDSRVRVPATGITDY